MRKTILWAALTAILLSSLLASVATYLDWSENPGGIFRGADGTNWPFVNDTFSSWFWPSLPPALIVTLAALLTTRWRRLRRSIAKPVVEPKA